MTTPQPIIILDGEDGIELLLFKTVSFRDRLWNKFNLESDSSCCKGQITNEHTPHCRRNCKKDHTRWEVLCERDRGTEICFCRQIKGKTVSHIKNMLEKEEIFNEPVSSRSILRVSLD